MRILKVRGVPDVNVSNPHTRSMRWVGKKQLSDGSYEVCDENINDHPDIREALALNPQSNRIGLIALDVETARLAGVSVNQPAANNPQTDEPKPGNASKKASS